MLNDLVSEGPLASATPKGPVVPSRVRHPSGSGLARQRWNGAERGSRTGTAEGVIVKRTPVDSTAIASVGYDESSQILELEYVDGDVYRYYDVPKPLHEALLDAPSIGQFVNTTIKGTFRHEQV